MTEEWRAVVGFEGLYEVSDFGRVRSLARVVHMKDGRNKSVPAKVLKPTLYAVGYYALNLWRDNKRHAVYVHQLVAQAFHGNADGLVVNHINMDKTDNRPQNLEWVSRGDNIRLAVRDGTSFCPFSNPNQRVTLTPETVHSIRLDRVSSNLTYAELAAKYAVGKGAVRHVCKGTTWKI